MCVVVQLLVTLLLECVDWSSARPDSSSIVSVGECMLEFMVKVV